MKTFKYVGVVYYTDPTNKQRVAMETTITIQAPNSAIANAIIRNYGLESVRIQF